ncbi:hypothetical protein [Candidatus Venteria ishoeyi]|uniref:Uncharacterized protein n=1 Tax=Candidatus Venteria ishoeyi TaxID=1899563 RepID=A0A1H6FDE9_9GAMM|nr:hypothetical protein [Candidatus Venteria ishoeyi]SEH08098.1 Uncharacterised protein [Candidatus Venteria ishoeyi]
MADASSIFNSKFISYLSSLKEISYDNENNIYLCQDESKIVYDFDSIVKNKYPLKQPASPDALLINDKSIYLIEFKNEKYSNVNGEKIRKKLRDGKHVLQDIFKTNNISIDKYKLIFCVAYKNTQRGWRSGVEKNIPKFGLMQYKYDYFNEIYTNDIQFFTNEYKKRFKKTLECNEC